MRQSDVVTYSAMFRSALSIGLAIGGGYIVSIIPEDKGLGFIFGLFTTIGLCLLNHILLIIFATKNSTEPPRCPTCGQALSESYTDILV